MSKRFIYPQQYGERKRARLDVSISDHNFPLSQTSAGSRKEPEQNDNWGDENDDEILLLASQACEDAYSQDISSVPDYSFCMQPPSTSTQIPRPSNSTNNFTFKKPTATHTNIVSTNLKDKCQRISSPLPGIANNVSSKSIEQVNLTDDFIFNDKIFKSTDSEYAYRQLLQLQEQNAKLKSENGKLLEKCVTKEGEASILRTQLKSCQVAVDNARMEKIKAQEKVQQEWNSKLASANSQLLDLKTQLDFKNLEIISTKEKCKMLESSKMKLTQVTVAPSDINLSHRNGHVHMESASQRRARAPGSAGSATSAAQTDNKTHFLNLNKICRIAKTNLKSLLPYMLQPSSENQSLSTYSDNLRKPPDCPQAKCRIFNTFHRIPSEVVTKQKTGKKMDISCVYEDVSKMVKDIDEGSLCGFKERFVCFLKSLVQSLEEVVVQLENMSNRMTTPFQREMDERYIEATAEYAAVCTEDLLAGKCLHKEEQAILARRLTAILACILEHSNNTNSIFKMAVEMCQNVVCDSERGNVDVVGALARICSLIDDTSCAVMYTGLLISITKLFRTTLKSNNKVIDIILNVITSRPRPAVSCELLNVISNLNEDVLSKLCCKESTGNLKIDHDQGVLLFKKESCHLQVLLKQVECCLKCIEKRSLTEQAVRTAECLVALYFALNIENTSQDTRKCECHFMMCQVIVYSLQICAVMLHKLADHHAHHKRSLTSISQLGVALVYSWYIRDGSFGARLAVSEGSLQVYLAICDARKEEVGSEVYSNMLSELIGSLQCPVEDLDLPSSHLKRVWLDSFSKISITE